ncbi:MAG: Hsp20/alpha crystallin family protein [Dehalococcoidia bacterium]|nr:MAG: Hsp20/alpha crystallin family protein [Dehalococcoidia bacterium]
MPDITVRSPLAELRHILEDWRDDDWRWGRLLTTFPTLNLPDEVLAVDVVESDGKYVVKASVLGFKREDITVEVADGTLSISAKRAEETEQKGEHFVRRERYSGSSTRRVALPGITRDSTVDAALKDGVIEVAVSVTAAQQAKRIDVREG